MSSSFSPAPGELDVPVDTPLRLTFDGPPRVDEAFVVTVSRLDDGRVVDTIALGIDEDALGPQAGTNGGRRRFVRRVPVSAEGSRLTIQLHHGVLAYDEDYAVSIDEGLVQGVLDGETFTGFGTDRRWRFHTRSAPPQGTALIVDDDGSADFRTLQGALDHVMTELDADTPATVSVRNGRYRELLYLRGKDQVTIVGESRDGVVVEYENFEGFNPGTGRSSVAAPAAPDGGRALFLVEAADLLTLDSLTLLNSHRRTGTGDQAETLYFNSDEGRFVAKNATFVSEQDTLQLKGYAWVYGCLVAGNVDFIWGGNHAALFEDCEIRTLGDSRRDTPSGGYVVQARTVALGDPGFVFLASRFTSAEGPAGTTVATGGAAATYLARSGGSASYFDNVAVVGCRLGSHIARAGWADVGINAQPAPNPAQASATSGWREYGSLDAQGMPLDVSARVAAARSLSASEADALSDRARVFSGFGGSGWSPEP